MSAPSPGEPRRPRPRPFPGSHSAGEAGAPDVPAGPPYLSPRVHEPVSAWTPSASLPAPPPPPRPKAARWPYVLLVAVLAVAGGVIGYRALHKDSSGPDYPKSWDPRVQFAVNFVEKTRGMPFKHPIEVDFLSEAAFQKTVAGDPSALSAAERRQLDDLAAVYRAVGLAHGRIDLGKALSQLRGGSVVGLYDFHTKKIYVRGQTLSLYARVTLVHELTHALQDQYFDVGAYEDKIAHDTSGAEDAFRDVVEGDAVRIENAYVASLSAAQRKAVDKQEKASAAGADKAIRGVPKILVTTQSEPYGFGRALMDYTVRAKGADAVNGLFRNWPTSDMQVMQPWRYFAGDKPLTVPTPALRHGEKRIQDGAFGEAEWYFMLASVLGPQRALAAVDGWAGDAMLAYRTGSHTCVRASYRAVNAAALRTFRKALDRWSAAEPALHAHESVAGGVLSFASCDPGATAQATGSDNSEVALQVAVTRVDLATGLLEGGLPVSGAVCGAKYALAHLTTAQLTATSATPAIRNAVRKAVAACPS